MVVLDLAPPPFALGAFGVLGSPVSPPPSRMPGLTFVPSVAAGAGPNVVFYECDVADRAAVFAVAREVEAKLGRP